MFQSQKRFSWDSYEFVIISLGCAGLLLKYCLDRWGLLVWRGEGYLKVDFFAFDIWSGIAFFPCKHRTWIANLLLHSGLYLQESKYMKR